MKYASLISTPVPQNKPLDARQVQNNAGGFVYQLDIWSRLDRFLILGSDSNTYYQKAADLTHENAQVVGLCWQENPVKTVDVIVSVSQEGRAPKNDAAIFALAVGSVSKDPKTKQIALGALPAVCRIGTHLFQFLEARKALGGGKGGRMLHRAVSKWYNDRSVNDVAFQMIKYRQRNGWSHANVMELHHPTAGIDMVRQTLYQWVREVKHNPIALPEIVKAHVMAMHPDTSKKQRLELVKEHKLPWEALPTDCNSDPDYWAAQLPSMGLTALVRNLGNMSRHGLLTPLSAAEKLVVERLSNEDQIRKSRLHPFNILVALKTYEQGHGFRGSGTWNVSRPIVNALDKAFYKAFKNVQPTGKRFWIGIDVSASMTAPIADTNLSCTEACAALSLVTANTETQSHIMMFDHGVRPSNIGAGDKLAEAARKIRSINGGGTDCSLPMTYALSKEIPVDVFVVLTDNETWAGRVHPTAALLDYRRKMKIDAKLIVVGMTSTGFSIADPQDAGMLDIVGFDTTGPAVMAEFARK